jgi:hypothetical protein
MQVSPGARRQAVLELESWYAGFLTGQNIVLDGGSFPKWQLASIFQR